MDRSNELVLENNIVKVIHTNELVGCFSEWDGSHCFEVPAAGAWYPPHPSIHPSKWPFSHSCLALDFSQKIENRQPFVARNLAFFDKYLGKRRIVGTRLHIYHRSDPDFIMQMQWRCGAAHAEQAFVVPEPSPPLRDIWINPLPNPQDDM